MSKTSWTQCGSVLLLHKNQYHKVGNIWITKYWFYDWDHSIYYHWQYIYGNIQRARIDSKYILPETFRPFNLRFSSVFSLKFEIVRKGCKAQASPLAAISKVRPILTYPIVFISYSHALTTTFTMGISWSKLLWYGYLQYCKLPQTRRRTT